MPTGVNHFNMFSLQYFKSYLDQHEQQKVQGLQAFAFSVVIITDEYVMRCAIWQHLYNLKNVEKPCKSVNFSKFGLSWVFLRFLKLAYFLRKVQTLRMNNSRILTIKNAKFLGYYFHMNLNIQGDFQICIILRLKRAYAPNCELWF